MFSYESFSQISSGRIRLSRLNESDFEEIFQNMYSPTTWVVAVRGVDSKEKLFSYLKNFVDRDAAGEGLTLVVRLQSTSELVGLSRFHSAGPRFTKVEIGFTWIADRWMRTFVNTEKKQLMLQYAFETMGVKRVEFSVDPHNEKSNAAMKRIGAKLEGTLRKWRFLNENDRGDRNIYSIIDDEWPQVKTDLGDRLSHAYN